VPVFAVLVFALAASGSMAADGRALIEKARTALQQNRFSEAKSAAIEALRVNPQSSDAEIILGLVATSANELAAAETHFARAVALQPANPRAHGYLGSTYLARQRLTDAAAEFSQVLKLDASNSAAQYNLGVIAALQQKPEIAVGHFESVARANPADIEALGALLRTQIALKRSSAARITAGQLQRALPVGDPRLSEAGALIASSGDYAGAIPILEGVHKSAPQSTDAAYNLALALFRAGQAERSLRVLQPFSRNAQALNLLGTIEEDRGRYAEAKVALELAAKLEPANEDYRVDYAVLLLHEATAEAGVSAFADAARDFPRSLRVRLGLGSAQYLAGRYEDAAATLIDAAALHSSSSLPYQLLARLYEAVPNQQERIRSLFQEYLHTEPRDAKTYSAYAAMLMSATRSDRGGDLSEVRRYLEKAIALDPKLPEAHLELGVLAHDEGNLQGAIQAFRTAVELAPDSSQAHYRLATALAKAGQNERSRAEMQAFQKLRSKERDREKELILRSLAGAQTP
jgi:tetratricopeptide (TPR) repeat protein